MTAFALANRFVGQIKELPGQQDHPFIQWCHSLCHLGMHQPDEVPWCSSFVNAVAWMLTLPRSGSAAARSWLAVGLPVESLPQAVVGFDVVVFKRGTNPALGHVGFYGGHTDTQVFCLGGNQGNAVSLAAFPVRDLVAIRRLQVSP